jgi:hypothetical protein
VNFEFTICSQPSVEGRTWIVDFPRRYWGSGEGRLEFLQLHEARIPKMLRGLVSSHSEGSHGSKDNGGDI